MGVKAGVGVILSGFAIVIIQATLHSKRMPPFDCLIWVAMQIYLFFFVRIYRSLDVQFLFQLLLAV